ncbi:MAG TPA: M3 family oligoendopeptidase [Cytophagaceae bacterium]
MEITSEIRAKKRVFLPESFRVENWEAIEPFFIELQDRVIGSVDELRQWFKDRSELEAVLSEDMGWRYIRMTCDTANKELTDRFNYFLSNIQPHIAPFSNGLNEKALNSPYLHLIKEPGYDIVIRNLEKDYKIFRENNIPLFTQIEQQAHTFGSISGAMTVEIDGRELTLQQAGDYLQSGDRKLREDVYLKIAERKYQGHEQLDELFSNLIKLRDEVARNADFENFRDYMFTSLGRFDYTKDECFEFHQAVSSEVVPILDEFSKERKEKLQLPELKPWDLTINYLGAEPLKPFSTGEELLEKTIQCFHQISPYLGACITTMKQMDHLDLESRKGKAPGGYNYPLDETGVPFIFMNATTTLRDLVTMVHEGGHALHSFVTRDLELNIFKNPPSEVAELASMSMELISMEHWEIFFPNNDDLKRAKREHLESIIQTLPWVATIDKFQHWIYENPGHSLEERKAEWNKIFNEFTITVTDWNGLERFKDFLWQKQLHLYEVPFYYIEYAIAQLGAIAVWKNYKKNREEAFNKYLAALKLGYSKPIREVYETAGVKFNFSRPYIKELVAFVKEELEKVS